MTTILTTASRGPLFYRQFFPSLWVRWSSSSYLSIYKRTDPHVCVCVCVYVSVSGLIQAADLDSLLRLVILAADFRQRHRQIAFIIPSTQQSGYLYIYTLRYSSRSPDHREKTAGSGRARQKRQDSFDWPSQIFRQSMIGTSLLHCLLWLRLFLDSSEYEYSAKNIA